MSYSKFLSVIFSLALAGCAVGPDFQVPQTAASGVSRYTDKPLPTKTVGTPGAIAGNSQRFLAGRNVPAEWWTLFHSKELNALIAEGLKNSPTLEAQKAAIRQAQENYNAAFDAVVFPNVTGNVNATRQLANDNSIGIQDTEIFNLYNASVAVTYNLDLWGGARRERESLIAQINYNQFEWEAAYLTLTSNIVTTAITEASLRAQISATQELIRSQADQLVIIEKQFNLGGLSQADVLTQKTQLAQSRATLPPLQKQLEQARDSLAALIGSVRGKVQLPTFHLDDLSLPATLPISLPANLVRQRPDIRASEELLHAASAQIGVAVANRLPQIQLTGNLGSLSTISRNLFGPGSEFWSISAGLTQTLFDAGSLHAKQRAAVAAYEQAAAQYKGAVLTAFQNVADALYAIQIDAHALQTQAEAEKVALAAFKLVQEQYRLGAVSYIARLDAERQYQQARIARIQAQAVRYADTAALFQALGGGWWNRKQEG